MSKLITLSDASSIGIHAMILIKRADDSINAGEIANRTGNSKHHVAKILQQLTKQGYINSLRGPLGGFILKKKPRDISFLNIYESIEGPIEIEECSNSDKQKANNKCITHEIISNLSEKLKNYLSNQTLDKF